MKKNKVLLLFISLTFIYCTKDEVENEKEINPLLGTWILNRIEVDESEIELAICDKENFYRFDKEIAMQFLSANAEETCIQKNFEGKWSESTDGLIIVTFTDTSKDAAFIVMNDEEIEIDEIVDVVLPDDTKEERLYVYIRE